jgi:hypothetical protein
MGNVSDNIAEKIKTYILGSVTFFPKILPLLVNVQKYGTARQDIDDNTTRSRKDAK